jgi:hypothetical protein
MAALVPAIHDFGVAKRKDVDARDEPGPDDRGPSSLDPECLFPGGASGQRQWAALDVT